MAVFWRLFQRIRECPIRKRPAAQRVAPPMVVDSSAVAALILEEPGADEVENLIDGGVMSAVNVVEKAMTHTSMPFAFAALHAIRKRCRCRAVAAARPAGMGGSARGLEGS